MSDKNHGTSGGIELTDELIERLADEAERGYDVEELAKRRRRGRPPIGSEAATVFHVRLEPELREALEIRADSEEATPSIVARRALRSYLDLEPSPVQGATAVTGERNPHAGPMRSPYRDLHGRVFAVQKHVLKPAMAESKATVGGTLLTAAVFHLRTAFVARSLQRMLETESVRELEQRFGETFEALDFGAMSFGLRALVTALDLCAASIYRLNGGTPTASGNEKSLRGWKQEQLETMSVPTESKEWVLSAKKSEEWRLLLEARDAVTHRHVKRRVYLSVGSDRGTLLDIVLAGEPYPSGQLMQRLLGFTEQRMQALCDALEIDYGQT